MDRDELAALVESVGVDVDYALGQLRSVVGLESRDRERILRALDALRRVQEACLAARGEDEPSPGRCGRVLERLRRYCGR